MKEMKYKNQNDKNYIIRIIVLLVLIFIFFLLSRVLNNLNKEPATIDVNNITTIKDVIEYHGSKYISDGKSIQEGYKIDAYLTLKWMPYNEDETSNESYYTNLIEDCARVIYYQSFRLIDEKNSITIEVICENNKVKTVYINGIEDYFIYMDSQKNMQKYTEIEEIDIVAASPILQECINNNWKNTGIDFGSRDSIFDDYYIYHDEGIKVRTIDGKIFNIVFNKNYKENVLEGIFPGMDLDSIKILLGKPAFSSDNLNLIGYKGKDFYAFFCDDEISIYRNKEEDLGDFFKLADKFLQEKINFLEFMNELTYLWPDYSDYEYDSDFVFISYPLKGIEIKQNYDDINGFLVYNNIKAGLPTISKYLENTYFVARLQLDLVFSSEMRRVSNQKGLIDKCLEFKESLNEEELEVIGESVKYDIYPLKDTNGYIFSMRFIAKDDSIPNRELNDGVYSFFWYGDYFIYSKRYKGIYYYDVNTGHVGSLTTSSKYMYKLKGIQDGFLKFDNELLSIPF